VSLNTTKSSPKILALMGVPSGSETCSTKQMASHWRRMSCPIGASPSTRHNNSFSSGVIMFFKNLRNYS
jgi:hypothetical protein